jgi:hypothetical protein
MLISIHEVVQRDIFLDLEDDVRDKLIRSFINNDSYAASINTAFEKNDNALFNRASPIQNLLQKSQKFLENDRNYRLLSVESPTIFCQNTESYKDENEFNVDLTDTIITPQHKVEFAKRNYSRGSCLTCVRDLNKTDNYYGVYVLKSQNVGKPKCIFYPPENRQKFSIHVTISVRVIDRDIFLSNILIQSTFDIESRVIRSMKSKGIEEQIIQSMNIQWSVVSDLNDSRINVKGLDVATRQNYGAFSVMTKKGYDPLIRYDQNSTLKGYPMIISILERLLHASCTGWNPLRFEKVQDILNRKNTKSYDYQERIEKTNDADTYNEYWPMSKICMSSITLEQFINSAQSTSVLPLSIRVNQFVEDNEIDNGIACFYLDEIILWRC